MATGGSKKKDFFKTFEEYIKREIRTTLPAKIISFDKSTMTADVLPLFLMDTDDNKQPVKMGVLQDLPVLGFRFEFMENVEGVETLVEKNFTPVYKKDDVVFISICDRNMDNFQDVPFLPNSSKKFSLHDAIVIGGYKLQ